MTVLWLILFFIIIPIAFGLIVRMTRIAGGYAIGGMLAGLIIGPSIIGTAFPDWYADTFDGAIAYRDSINKLDARHRADRRALIAATADLAQLVELEDQQRAERAPYVQAVENATWNHHRPHRMMMALFVTLTLLCAGCVRLRDPDANVDSAASIAIGLWSSLGPASLAFLMLRGVTDLGLFPAVMSSAAIAIGPWAMTAIDRKAANDAEIGGAQTMQRAGSVASVLALVAIGFALSMSEAREPWWALVLLAHPISWFIPAIINEERRERFLRLVQIVLLPPLTALAMTTVELQSQFAFLTWLVLVVLSGDGRWIGAVFGAVTLGSRGALRTMRLTLGAMSCGPTQLAVTAVGVHLGLIPGTAAVALVLGAVMLEVLAPTRRNIARELEEIEEEGIGE
ncbi:MAG: hypothetical protein AAF432_13695 [Planctomycetota bacterium]